MDVQETSESRRNGGGPAAGRGEEPAWQVSEWSLRRGLRLGIGLRSRLPVS